MVWLHYWTSLLLLLLLCKNTYLKVNLSFIRLKLKSHMTPGKAKKGGAAPASIEPPTHCTVYVAKSYPAWQSTILQTMKDMYKTGVPDNKAISVEMGKKPELKKYMKRVMPFVAFMKEKVVTSGMSALDTSLPWDEMKVLEENKDYIVNTLQLEDLNLAASSELGEKGEDCRPGQPLISFRYEIKQFFGSGRYRDFFRARIRIRDFFHTMF